jgi:hypothetical protein
LDKKGFCKEGFVLKTVPNMERRGKDKIQRVQNVM